MQLGVTNCTINKTRLKEMLLHHLPGLESFKSGREIVFTFTKHIGPALFKASQYDQAVILEKAALFLRKQMLECQSKFLG